MKSAADAFPQNIQNCGVAAGKELQNVINSCQDVSNTATDIITLNDSTCQNSADADENTANTAKCIGAMATQMYKFNKQLKNTISLIKKVPAVPGAAGDCMQNELNNLTSTFTSFPNFVQECSKLTS